MLPADKARAIEQAAQEVIAGKWDAEFPLVVFQTGSGTQTNMNANEVIARRASEIGGVRVHPNDDVNRCQSSNDVFPTVMHIATVEQIESTFCFQQWARCAIRWPTKGDQFASVVMVGRTHLQDATPVTLGQIVSGWVAQIDQALTGIRAALPALYELAIGGTAVGTGLNAHPQFGESRGTEHR